MNTLKNTQENTTKQCANIAGVEFVLCKGNEVSLTPVLHLHKNKDKEEKQQEQPQQQKPVAFCGFCEVGE